MRPFRPGDHVRLRSEWLPTRIDLPYTVVPCRCSRCASGHMVAVVAPRRSRHLTASWLRLVGTPYLRLVSGS